MKMHVFEAGFTKKALCNIPFSNISKAAILPLCRARLRTSLQIWRCHVTEVSAKSPTSDNFSWSLHKKEQFHKPDWIPGMRKVPPFFFWNTVVKYLGKQICCYFQLKIAEKRYLFQALR